MNWGWLYSGVGEWAPKAPLNERGNEKEQMLLRNTVLCAVQFSCLLPVQSRELYHDTTEVKVRPEGKLHSHRHKSVCANALLRALQHWLLNGGDGRRVALRAVLLNGVGCFQQSLLLRATEGEAYTKQMMLLHLSLAKKHHKMQGIGKEN